ncbi:MAG: adenylyl-sulfate kinase [Phycisphaerae bacterium]|nr:adenylyl-sulfate kinase [Planctomycetota bacterium]MBL7220589.1 adenylyl-sulfate kinase [Phycisphaerae bacterium]
MSQSAQTPPDGDLIVPGTIWITGIPASGKTTLGKCLYEALLSRGISNVEWLDGEEVRKRLKDMYGFSTDDRTEVARYVIKLVREYNTEGKVVLVSTISHRIETRSWIRSEIDRFMEVYLKCSAGVCAARDYKDHYRKAFNGEYSNFPGVSEPYEESDPELVLDTANSSVSECSELLVARALEFIGAQSPAARRS